VAVLNQEELEVLRTRIRKLESQIETLTLWSHSHDPAEVRERYLIEDRPKYNYPIPQPVTTTAFWQVELEWDDGKKTSPDYLFLSKEEAEKFGRNKLNKTDVLKYVGHWSGGAQYINDPDHPICVAFTVYHALATIPKAWKKQVLHVEHRETN